MCISVKMLKTFKNYAVMLRLVSDILVSDIWVSDTLVSDIFPTLILYS